MGKNRKVSKGYSSGLVPDYRYVVETMGESEGFGSSNWMDVDMTASADSSASKRKEIKNRMGYDRFYAPFQVVSLSNMSRNEKKALEVRLRGELQQVRILQKRISSVNAVILSPDSDIHSCTEGLKRPIESIQRPDMTKPLPPRNGITKKGPGLRRTEAVVQTLPSDASNSLLVKQCEDLVSKLLKHKFGYVFAVPVDVVKHKIPDYFTIIKHPMDLGTVRDKLLSGEYLDLSRFGADVRLTFSNAMTYNPPGNDVHFMAKTLSKFFELRWKPIENKILSSQALAPKPSSLVEKETTVSMPPSKKLKAYPLDNMIESDGNVTKESKRIMSDIEKQRLRTELESSLAELPDAIIDFLKVNSSNDCQASEDEIEIDLDTLSDDTLFGLRKLLDEFLAARPNELKETNEAEVLLESRLSPEKGKEYADACIDISGNGPPTSSSTQVDNEKEIDLKNSRLKSSSSTSESCSSSSDSESESCSKELSDVAKASAPVVDLPKESYIAAGGTTATATATTTNTITTEEHMKDGGVDTSDVEAALPSVRDDVCLEADGAPPVRQVSPEKLYRAALLRSRFADTIIRAQEKTHEKDEKLDPEKLQIEREMLEKRRKQEKARLQAEAKAVEEARRKSEEEAAAEARRNREVEREAARQALLMMEKTVDINENSQFMEDLQMFGSSVGPTDEYLLLGGSGTSFIEEARTPDLSVNFSFQATGNPLEQLGLYMKRDDDEDEEPPPEPPRTGGGGALNGSDLEDRVID